MRASIVVLIVILVATIASAQHLGNRPPVKPAIHVERAPAPADRQGGENIADAFPIPGLPFADSGTTEGYFDDYERSCPYWSNSPDVVYSWVSYFDGALFVDLCGSLYDTKVFMYDSELNVIDCNDDYYYDEECGVYVSALEHAPVELGETYYFVIDGYGGSWGEYLLYVEEIVPPPPCELECWGGEWVQEENEPPLVDEYVDEWNGGCNSDPAVFQWIECEQFCGVAGWYVYTGLNYRDTDWFKCIAGQWEITWTVDAESETYCFELVVPPDCAATVTQSMTVGPCTPGTMIIYTEPGQMVDLWVGSADFSNPGGVPGNEYDYIWEIVGVEVVSATEQQTWSGVKSLFR